MIVKLANFVLFAAQGGEFFEEFVPGVIGVEQRHLQGCDGMPPAWIAGQDLVEPGDQGERGALDLFGQLAGGQGATAGLIEQFAQALLQFAGLFLDRTSGNAFVQVQAE